MLKISFRHVRIYFLFGAISNRTWEWKSPDIPSCGFLFAFAGALELIPFGARSDLHWNFPEGTLAKHSVWRPIGSTLAFAIPGDSFSGFLLVSPHWGLLWLFVRGEQHFPPLGFPILLLSWRYPYIFPYMHAGETPDEKQCRSDRKFIREELHKIFVCWRLRNQSNVITVTNQGNLAIGGSPPPTIGDFTTTPKIPKCKTISRPTKFP